MTTDPQRLLVAALALLAWLALCGGIALRERRRRRASAAAAAALAGDDSPATDSDAGTGAATRTGARATSATAPVLVAFASQTGMAEQLAWQAARWLHAAGLPVRLAPLGQVGAEQLASAGQALFLVSTYGEGDAPDNASGFARRVMDAGLPLPGLHYAVLALGDRSYANFCGFGRRLDGWLRSQGALPLFERIDVDNAGAPALAAWHERLQSLATAGGALPDIEPALASAPFAPWRVRARRHLNPGSLGEPIHHVELRPADGAPLPEWQAGDLAQLLVPADPQRPRDYSIASLPADGALHLLVRQQRREDGTPGLASRLLAEAPLHEGGPDDASRCGEPLMLRIRPNRGFRLEGNAGRKLLLVGNGSGIAGLRALLKARAAARAGAAADIGAETGAKMGAATGATAGTNADWLVFGERQAAHDTLYREDVDAWLASGVLERVDRVFSRDGPAPEYVQDRLERCAEQVRARVDEGAAIYVCGSLRGMASGVDDALARILGRDALDALIDEGRYRRDVY